MDLTEFHQAQVSRFIGFFKGKRDSCVRDRGVLNQEFISDHLSDDSAIFNRDQVEGIVQMYMQQAMEGLNEELEKVSKLGAVYCTELMRSAQAQGINLQTEDISVVEDQNRIDHVNALTALGRAPMPAAPKQQLLPTLGSGGSADPAMVQQLQDAREETRQMTERYQMMQTQVTSLLQERSSLSGELENVKANFAELRSTMAASGADMASQQRAAEMEARMHQTSHALATKSAEMEAMRREMEGRLGDSQQFRQLKAIIKEKNNQIKTLRGQLQAAGYAVDTGGADLTADSD